MGLSPLEAAVSLRPVRAARPAEQRACRSTGRFLLSAAIHRRFRPMAVERLSPNAGQEHLFALKIRGGPRMSNRKTTDRKNRKCAE
jgi:hypothetical protein